MTNTRKCQQTHHIRESDLSRLLPERDREKFETVEKNTRRKNLLDSVQSVAVGVAMQWLEQNGLEPESLVDSRITIVVSRDHREGQSGDTVSATIEQQPFTSRG